jgi:hypothetical protein
MDLGVTISLICLFVFFPFLISSALTHQKKTNFVCVFFSSPSAAGIFDPARVLFIVKPIFLSPSQFREERNETDLLSCRISCLFLFSFDGDILDRFFCISHTRTHGISPQPGTLLVPLFVYMYIVLLFLSL